MVPTGEASAGGVLAMGAIAAARMELGPVVTARLAGIGRWLPGVLLGCGRNLAAGAAACALVYSVVICLRL